MAAPTISPLAIDKEYAEGETLTEVQLDAALIDSGTTAVQGYLNEKISPNIVQLAKDCQGDDYDFTDTGDANFTWSLYEKQWEEHLYNGGDISIGVVTDASFASVDAINAALTFTPERVGRYRVTFKFTHFFELNATSEGSCQVLFRIYDGAGDSAIEKSGGYFPATAANAVQFSNPVLLTYIFEVTTAEVPVTFLLQKRVMAATNVSVNQVSATATTGEFYASVEKV